MYNLRSHLYPQTIQETLSMLQEPNARLIAGGTALALSKNLSTQTLIDLQDLDLSYIKDEGKKFVIGAMTTAYDIYKHPDLPFCLRTAARQTGDSALLHAITIGGNLARLYTWVDLPPALWALNASIILYDPEQKTLSADEFFSYSKERNMYRRKALITEVHIPKPPANCFNEYQSLTSTQTAKAQLSLASYLVWDSSDSISEVRLVASAATKFPTRILAEKLLVGLKLTDELIEECANQVMKEVLIRPDFRSSIEYRRHILGVYLKRTLQKCQKRIGGR